MILGSCRIHWHQNHDLTTWRHQPHLLMLGHICCLLTLSINCKSNKIQNLHTAICQTICPIWLKLEKDAQFAFLCNRPFKISNQSNFIFEPIWVQLKYNIFNIGRGEGQSPKGTLWLDAVIWAGSDIRKTFQWYFFLKWCLKGNYKQKGPKQWERTYPPDNQTKGLHASKWSFKLDSLHSLIKSWQIYDKRCVCMYFQVSFLL